MFAVHCNLSMVIGRMEWVTKSKNSSEFGTLDSGVGFYEINFDAGKRWVWGINNQLLNQASATAKVQ